MASKRILLADGAGLIAYQWRSGRIDVEGEFSSEPAGLEALAGYLKKHRSSVFCLLADVAEEGFQIEDLPYVQGSDRDALVKRRLGQYFYNTPLSLAMSLGRASEGRRDEKILFAALTRPEALTPWLDSLRESESILAGVFSVPLVLAQIAAKNLGGDSPTLLLTVTRGGVRQTFFDKGKLHFSRLTQLAVRSIEEIGRICFNDSAKIFQYLVAQRQIPRGSTLRTIIVAEESQTETLREYCQSSGEIQFEFLAAGDLARKQGLKDTLSDSNIDRLLLHVLAGAPPRQQFAAPTETRFHRLWKIRSALTSVAWLALFACLLYAGKTGLHIAELRGQSDLIRIATAEDTRRYEAILAQLPKINVSPENLRLLIARYDALEKRLPGMEPMLIHLSQALNDYPRIELTRMNWRMADTLDAKQAAAGARPVSGVPQGAPATQAKGSGWIVAEIEAKLPLVLVSDQRAQLELIEGFAKRLRAQDFDVLVLTRPFDIESDKPLRSASEGRAANSEVPRFSLRVARNL